MNLLHFLDTLIESFVVKDNNVVKIMALLILVGLAV